MIILQILIVICKYIECQKEKTRVYSRFYDLWVDTRISRFLCDIRDNT